MELTLDQALKKDFEAHKAGQGQEAERLYAALLTILKDQPKHPDANHHMGLLAVGVGKIKEALPFLKTALETNPNVGQYWLSYIDALVKLDRVSDAKVVFNQAKGKGASGDAFDQLERWLSDPSAHPQDPPPEELQSIINLYTQGQMQQALSESNRMLERFPNSAALHNIAGGSNTALMQIDAAIESYKRALQIKPDSAAIYNNMGNALNDKGDPEAAIACYKQALIIKPDYAQVYNNMGATLNGKGNHDAAIDSFKQALKIKPEYAEAHNNMGNALKDKGELEAAIDSFKQALKINPNYAEAYNNMGVILSNNGDPDAAVDNYNKAIKIKPSYAEAHKNLGLILADLGRLQEAEVSYRQAIALKSDYAEVYFNLGAILADLGRLQEAEANYRQAIGQKQNYAEAYCNLGTTLKEQGRLEVAEVSYKKAIALKPGYVEATHNLGVLLYESKQYNKAAVQFKLVDLMKSKCYLLRCLYLQDHQASFYDQLDYLLTRGGNNAVIGSLISRSKIRYGINTPNPFCNNPFKYILKTDLTEQCDFKNIFVKGTAAILSDDNVKHKFQTLITNGIQTGGNVFTQGGRVTDAIQNIIHSELEKYRVNFKDSEEGLIKNWPTDYSLYGWLVSMKSGGELTAHMHDSGWITGSIYINVPPKSKIDSGNLVVCIDYEKCESGKNKESIDVATGSLCLFPSSLLHYTIPFEAEEDRIVLAFDVIPNN